MPPDGDDKHDKRDGQNGESFDVVLMHGATADGAGTRVLRARPGHLEAGEVRPLREGQPLAPGGEVVRLTERAGMPCVYDVKVDCKVPSLSESKPRPAHGPAQIASPAYRESWDRTFALGPATSPKALPN